MTNYTSFSDASLPCEDMIIHNLLINLFILEESIRSVSKQTPHDQAETNELLALIALYRALGGGWEVTGQM